VEICIQTVSLCAAAKLNRSRQIFYAPRCFEMQIEFKIICLMGFEGATFYFKSTKA